MSVVVVGSDKDNEVIGAGEWSGEFWVIVVVLQLFDGI